MSDREKILSELIDLSRWLGAPEQDCAILGEGNASAKISADTYLVKASGTELRTLDAEGLVEISLTRSLAMLEDPALDDHQVRNLLLASKVDADDPRLPSVETPLHAVCLLLDGVNFVGHTHPTAINSFTCSVRFEEALRDRLFPDEVVVCGPEPLLVPYADPGVVLARVVQQRLSEYLKKFGTPPKTIYMQNHGFIALGATAKQVKAITAMAVKAARILIGTYAFGGPQALGSQNVQRIHSRLDEHYRQRIIEN